MAVATYCAVAGRSLSAVRAVRSDMVDVETVESEDVYGRVRFREPDRFDKLRTPDISLRRAPSRDRSPHSRGPSPYTPDTRSEGVLARESRLRSGWYGVLTGGYGARNKITEFRVVQYRRVPLRYPLVRFRATEGARTASEASRDRPWQLRTREIRGISLNTSMTDTVIIRNPKSGSADHAEAVRKRAELLGYALERTHEPGDAIDLAEEAAEAGFSTVVAGGGDGTVNEVVRGIDRAGAFDDVTLGVLPLGTGNNFAEQIGITDLETAFEILEEGSRRRIDLGRADGRPFVNSCVAGLTAESSSETSAEMKDRLGVLAYVITTLRSVPEFESLRLTIDSEERSGETTAWVGEALCVLIGNGRRFTTEGSTQADMEDGLFDLVIIRDVSAIDLMSDAVIERLLGQDSAHIIRTRTPTLTITSHDPETTRFSLDGEIVQRRELSFDVQPRTLRVAVGDAYDPHPE